MADHPPSSNYVLHALASDERVSDNKICTMDRGCIVPPQHGNVSHIPSFSRPSLLSGYHETKIGRPNLGTILRGAVAAGEADEIPTLLSRAHGLWTPQCTPAGGLLESPNRHEPSSPRLSAKRTPPVGLLRSPSGRASSPPRSTGHHQVSSATMPGPVLIYNEGEECITNGVSSDIICLVHKQKAFSPRGRDTARISPWNEDGGPGSTYSGDGTNRELWRREERGVAAERQNKGNRKSRGETELQWQDCPISPFSSPSGRATVTVPSAADVGPQHVSNSFASESCDTASPGGFQRGARRDTARGNAGAPSAHMFTTAPQAGNSDNPRLASATDVSNSKQCTTTNKTVSRPTPGKFGGWRVGGGKIRGFRGSKGGNRMASVMLPTF